MSSRSRGTRGTNGEDGSFPLHRQLLPEPVCRRVVQSSCPARGPRLDSAVARSRLGTRGTQRRSDLAVCAACPQRIGNHRSRRRSVPTTMPPWTTSPAPISWLPLKKREHRPLMRKRFAKWEHVPDYWNVHDVEHTAPTEALKLLAQEVQMLLLRFGNGAV